MNKNRLLIYSTVFLIMGLSNSVVPVLPEIASLGPESSGSLEYTLLFSGYFIGALLTMIPFGFLADIYENIKLITMAIALTFLTGLMLIFSQNIYVLISARLLEGIACGAFFPPAYSILSRFREKNRYIGEFNFLLNAGLAFGVLSSGFLADWSVRGAIILFTILAVTILILGLYSAFRVKSPKKVRVKKISPLLETKNVLNSIYDKKYLRIWITAFLIFGITGVMLAFYSDYSKDMLSKPELGIAIAILYVTSMATNIIVGRMNLGFKTMIFAGIILAATGVFLSIRYPFIGFALLGIGSGTGMIGLPIAVSHMSIERGLAMGIFNTYTYAGLAFMPMIASLFINLGYPLLFTLTSFLMILSLFMKDGLIIENNH